MLETAIREEGEASSVAEDAAASVAAASAAAVSGFWLPSATKEEVAFPRKPSSCKVLLGSSRPLLVVVSGDALFPLAAAVVESGKASLVVLALPGAIGVVISGPGGPVSNLLVAEDSSAPSKAKVVRRLLAAVPAVLDVVVVMLLLVVARGCRGSHDVEVAEVTAALPFPFLWLASPSSSVLVPLPVLPFVGAALIIDRRLVLSAVVVEARSGFQSEGELL